MFLFWKTTVLQKINCFVLQIYTIFLGPTINNYLENYSSCYNLQSILQIDKIGSGAKLGWHPQNSYVKHNAAISAHSGSELKRNNFSDHDSQSCQHTQRRGALLSQCKRTLSNKPNKILTQSNRSAGTNLFAASYQIRHIFPIRESHTHTYTQHTHIQTGACTLAAKYINRATSRSLAAHHLVCVKIVVIYSSQHTNECNASLEPCGGAGTTRAS